MMMMMMIDKLTLVNVWGINYSSLALFSLHQSLKKTWKSVGLPTGQWHVVLFWRLPSVGGYRDEHIPSGSRKCPIETLQ